MIRFSSSAGRNGVSITLVTQYDIHLVHSIEKQTRELLGYKGGITRWHFRECSPTSPLCAPSELKHNKFKKGHHLKKMLIKPDEWELPCYFYRSKNFLLTAHVYCFQHLLSLSLMVSALKQSFLIIYIWPLL